MPIDPGIALSSHGLGPLVNPMEIAEQAARMRQARETSLALAEQRRAQTAAREQQTAAAARAQAEETALRALFSTGKPVAPDAIHAIVGPQRGTEIVKGMQALHDEGLKTFKTGQEAIGAALGGLEALPEAMRPDGYTRIRQKFTANGWIDPTQVPEQYDPKFVQAARQWAMTPAEQTAANKPIDHDPTHELRSPTGALIAAAQPKPEVKAFQSKDVLVNGKPAVANFDPHTGKYFDAAGAELQDVRPIPPRPTQISVAGAAAANNVKDVIAGMKDGSIPPQMPGRASKEYVELLAEAKRQGYNLAGAVTDWTATQKHIATMNGAQQLRLNQAINALPEMLDSVDALASKWKGGKFPILNKANLALAKGGAYGSDVASVANQLDAQIADVTADLGNVYMGGNSPTDHALGLAGKSLNGEWDEKVLHDMVKLAKQNVTIRRNSINSTGVAGASDSNPYGNQQPAAAQAPAQPAAAPKAAPPAPGMIRARDPQGNIHEAKAGTALPQGWVKVGG